MEEGNEMSRTVHLMPKTWAYPFVSAWRVFERTLNPAFTFVIRCSACGAKKAHFVMSTKTPNALLGLECKSCLLTIKFEDVIDPDAEDFPVRLLTKPDSVLSTDGKPIKSTSTDSEGYVELMFGDE